MTDNPLLAAMKARRRKRDEPTPARMFAEAVVIGVVVVVGVVMVVRALVT